MGLQAILDTILASGQARADAVEARAAEDAGRILDEAGADARNLHTAARRAASAGARAECARIIHRGQFQAMQVTGAVRESLVDEALGRVRRDLRSARSDPDYPLLLSRLAAEALTSLRGAQEGNDRVHLQADPRDRALLHDIAGGLQGVAEVAYTLETWGGVVALSADGRVVVDNTLEGRLRRAEPYLRRCLPLLLDRDGAPR